jgi:hypothetical protein
MLTRNGQVACHGRVNSEGAFSDELSLFDFAKRREQTIYLTPNMDRWRNATGASFRPEDGLRAKRRGSIRAKIP